MRFPSQRWRLGLLAALLLAGAVVLGCALALGPGSGVTEANCDRIQEGMTTREVALILGGPPGDYTTRTDPGSFAVELHGCPIVPEETRKCWVGDEGMIRVRFDQDGKVVGVHFTEREHFSEPFPVRVRRWLRSFVREHSFPVRKTTAW